MHYLRAWIRKVNPFNTQHINLKQLKINTHLAKVPLTSSESSAFAQAVANKFSSGPLPPDSCMKWSRTCSTSSALQTASSLEREGMRADLQKWEARPRPETSEPFRRAPVKARSLQQVNKFRAQFLRKFVSFYWSDWTFNLFLDLGFEKKRILWSPILSMGHRWSHKTDGDSHKTDGGLCPRRRPACRSFLVQVEMTTNIRNWSDCHLRESRVLLTFRPVCPFIYFVLLSYHMCIKIWW